MDIPIKVANELWKDYPNILKEFEGWNYVRCDVEWDEDDKAILTPVSLSILIGRCGCNITYVSTIGVNLTELSEPKEEYDGLLEGCCEKIEDKFMNKCLARAEVMLDERNLIGECLVDFTSPIASIAVALFQSGIDQVIAAKEKANSKVSGNTGLQG